MGSYSASVLALLLCAATGVFGEAPLGSKSSTVASAADVGAGVQSALRQANETGLGGLKLGKATLTLETTTSRDVGGKIKFLIFTISHEQNKGETLTTTMTFAEEEPVPGAERTKLSGLKDSLAQAIANAALVASQVNVLPLSEATITLEFAVRKTSEGGLSFEILGINIGGDVNFDNVSKNSLAVTFHR